MTRILDNMYFGRLDRGPFFVLIVTATGLFLISFAALVMSAGVSEGRAVIAAVLRSGNLLDTPSILLAHGVSEHRTAGIMTVIGLYLIGCLFLLAARGRDIGLMGWPTAVAALAVFLVAGQAGPWLAGLAGLVGAGFLIWPPRSV